MPLQPLHVLQMVDLPASANLALICLDHKNPICFSNICSSYSANERQKKLADINLGQFVVSSLPNLWITRRDKSPISPSYCLAGPQKVHQTRLSALPFGIGHWNPWREAPLAQATRCLHGRGRRNFPRLFRKWRLELRGSGSGTYDMFTWHSTVRVESDMECIIMYPCISM